MDGARKFSGALRSLVNARGLQLEWVRLLHEALLMLVLFYGTERMTWRVKESLLIKTVQMDNAEVCWVLRVDMPNMWNRVVGSEGGGG